MVSVNAVLEGKVNTLFTENKKSGEAMARMQLLVTDDRGISEFVKVKLWKTPDNFFKKDQQVRIPVLIKVWKGDKGGVGLECNYFHRDGKGK